MINIFILDDQEGPILNYGNSKALQRWAASWEELTSMPSSRTAEPQNREARARAMEMALQKGFNDNYSGLFL